MTRDAFADAANTIATVVEQLTDNSDLGAARDLDGYPAAAHTAAIGALYRLRDQLTAAANGTPARPELADLSGTCPCGGTFRPYDIVEGTVETDTDITGFADAGVPDGYQASGYTDIHYDTQQSVGVVCDSCYDVHATVDTIEISRVPYAIVAR